MVAITTLTNVYAPRLHTGGSAARETPPVTHDTGAQADTQADTPAAVVTLSDQAQMLIAEAKAAEAVADIFAIANGVARSAETVPPAARPQALIAHDVQANAGLYILWSHDR